MKTIGTNHRLKGQIFETIDPSIYLGLIAAIGTHKIIKHSHGLRITRKKEAIISKNPQFLVEKC